MVELAGTVPSLKSLQEGKCLTKTSLYQRLLHLLFLLAHTLKQMQFVSSGHDSSCLYMSNLQAEKLNYTNK